jgi:hypothetical protein
MAQNYLFIAILCAKMSRVTWALSWTCWYRIWQKVEELLILFDFFLVLLQSRRQKRKNWPTRIDWLSSCGQNGCPCWYKSWINLARKCVVWSLKFGKKICCVVFKFTAQTEHFKFIYVCAFDLILTLTLFCFNKLLWFDISTIKRTFSG